MESVAEYHARIATHRKPWTETRSIYTRIPENPTEFSEPENIDPKVTELLKKGIECLEQDKNEEAIEHLSEAIKLEDKHSLLYINRSAAYAKLKNLTDALEDMETTVELRPDWPMAYMRKGTVLLELFRHRFAHTAFTKAVSLEPTNESFLKSQFEALTRMQKRKNNPYPVQDFHPLQDKSTQIFLRMDPITKHLMDEPEHVKIIEEIRKNPSVSRKYAYEDENYGVAMCISVASALDVNKSSIDYSDIYEPEEHRKKVKRFGGYPWVPDYSPIKEIHILPPPPKKKPEERVPELLREPLMPADFLDMEVGSFRMPEMELLVDGPIPKPTNEL